MSHNTYAALSVPVKLVNGNRDGRLYSLSGSNTGCLSYPDNYSYAQNTCSDVTVLATSVPIQFAQGATFYSNNIVDIPLYFTLNSNNNALDAWLRNLTLDSNSNSRWSLIDVDYQNLTSSSALAHIYIKAYVTNTDWSVTLTSNNNFILGLQPNEVIGIGNINVWEIVDTTVDTQSIVDAIESQTPAPSAEDIADAVNAPEEEAAEAISNQSTDDIETGDDSSATNLIGNINTLFTQIGNIQASDTCSISADFGNLDLGDINFCTGKDKLPFVVTFGAYAFELVFVVGTAIILVKQVLGLFDWARS